MCMYEYCMIYSYFTYKYNASIKNIQKEDQESRGNDSGGWKRGGKDEVLGTDMKKTMLYAFIKYVKTNPINVYNHNALTNQFKNNKMLYPH